MNEALAKILAQKERNTKSVTKSANKTEFSLRNYFTTFLDGAQSGRFRVRIIGIENETPFVEAHAHGAKVDGKFATLFCPSHEKDEPCPFCEVRDELLAKGGQDNKDLAKDYRARKVYLLKVIDRDDEEWGPKIWRFKHSWKKDGVYDKIMDLFDMYGDISDNKIGRDLVINVTMGSNGYATISSILADPNPSPISTDEVEAEKWVNDKKQWTDVYGVKSYEYLKIVVLGGDPIWDKENQKFIDKSAPKVESTEIEEDPSSALTMGGNGAEITPSENKKPSVIDTPIKTETPKPDEDDLPF